MSIHPQLKNVFKLLLIGAVLFIVSAAVSVTCSNEIAGKKKQVCKADVTKKIYANATKQIRLESPDLLFINKNSIRASVPATAVTPQTLAAIAGDSIDYEGSGNLGDGKSIIEYLVEQGDTIESIAERFSLKAQTILWANDLKAGAVPKPGVILIIPPVDGVIYNITSGDTLSKIAKTYKASESEIIAFNEMEGENDLFVGDVLVVPGGTVPKIAAAPKPGASSSALSLPQNYFLCPINAPCRRTQGLHFQNAVDLSHGKCGEPIYAAASGTVLRAKIGGWNGGAGNYITILHPSGAITKYYHLQTVFVASGQQVAKGQNIALMGGQPGAAGSGKSTGCHLHFEIIGAKNPF